MRATINEGLKELIAILKWDMGHVLFKKSIIVPMYEFYGEVGLGGKTETRRWRLLTMLL